ncbi:MAG TPA: hypothetical protein VMG34_09225, partial [Bacteroidota bacterium]|nr:hypothetical protein [Bacteroidota bacterium]
MKLRQYLTYAVTLVFAGLFSCANPTSTSTTTYTVTLSGTFVNTVATRLDSVRIVLWSPFAQDTAKSDGSFTLSFSAQDKSTVTDSVTFARNNFVSQTRAFSYSPTNTSISFSTIVLKGVSGAQDSLAPTRPSLRAGQIVYLGASAPNLSIYGAGGTDALTLTFQVRDSIGNPVDTTNQTLVHFRFATTPPDTFTQLSISSAKTNSTGSVTVLLGAGFHSGIASVQAYAAVKQTPDTTKVDTIMSAIVNIPIFGGYPDSAHFSMSVAKVNIPGGVQTGLITPITALIGDRYGNPAQPGTIVYFTTNGGLVSPASSSSSADGSASSNLISGNPIPVGGLVTVTAELATGGSGAAGKSVPAAKVGMARSLTDGDTYAPARASKKQGRMSKTLRLFEGTRSAAKYFTDVAASAKTVARAEAKVAEAQPASVSARNSRTAAKKSAVEDGALVTSGAEAGMFYVSVNVLFTGAPIISIPDTSLNVFVSKPTQLNFKVADKYGNPLSAGSEIKVSTTGSGASAVALTGDVDRILPDTKDTSFTNFAVFARDTNALGPSENENFNLSIVVTSPNGNVSRNLIGTLYPSGISDTTSAASVKLVNTSVDSLTVTGGGGVSSEQIRFQVLNTGGNPAPNVQVQFAFARSVGGGEYFSPAVALSDANGNVQTTLFAGIRSGAVQIVAKAKRDTSSIVSNPKTIYIRTGIIASIAVVNVSAPALSVLGVGGLESSTITFEGRDSLGNAVDASNSAAIKFSLQGDTAARVSPNVAVTDPVTGRVTTSFTSGTHSGLAYVTASARGDSVKSSPVQLAISGGFPDSLHFSIAPSKLNIAGAAIYGLTDNVGLVVGDKYGNPAQPGSVVYFSSTGGVIAPSVATSTDGTAGVNLISGLPYPAHGLAVITASVGATASGSAGSLSRKGTSTKGGMLLDGPRSARLAGAVLNNAPSFSRQTTVMFSGPTAITPLGAGFQIPVNQSVRVLYRVSDYMGNPLVAGSSIQVASSGPAAASVTMDGDISVTMPDTQDTLATFFGVNLTDNRTTASNTPKTLVLTVTVSSPNGNGKLSFSGTLLGTNGVGVDSSIVSRIVLQNPSPDSIIVAGLGGTTKDTVNFKVYNTFGLPAKNVLVTFGMPQSLGGGEYLSPPTALTDTGGNVRTVITSGTKYGEVLISATTTQDSITLSSAPKVVYIVIPPSSRLASQVLYLGATATDIFVDGVGAVENSTIGYQVTDSLGIPIDRQRRVGVTYTIQFFPNSTIAGGTPPSVMPSTDSTDDNGQLHTSVISGTEAGVVQVVAHIIVPGRGTLISQPVKITVHAGFADQAHFTLIPSHYVSAGLNNKIPFTVEV